MLMRDSLALETRQKTPIDNYFDRNPVLAGATAAIAMYKRIYSQAMHRDDVGPTAMYNCHGLTFAARRTQVIFSEVAKILRDDDYIVIDYAEVTAGDIAVYRSMDTGDVEHSGIVVGRGTGLVNGPPGAPVILGKWGNLHEVAHLPPQCPYDKCTVMYYRIRNWSMLKFKPNLSEASANFLVANTPLFLARKLRSDNAIYLFSRSASASDIFDTLADAISKRPQTVEDAVLPYALLVALSLKPERNFLQNAARLNFQYSDWFKYIADYFLQSYPSISVQSVTAPSTKSSLLMTGNSPTINTAT
jgi:hypothetical protein